MIAWPGSIKASNPFAHSGLLHLSGVSGLHILGITRDGRIFMTGVRLESYVMQTARKCSIRALSAGMYLLYNY